MTRKHFTRLYAAAILAATGITAAQAQATAADAMKPGAHATIVPYNIADEGVEQPMRWGIDTAWDWDWWPLRATNHMKECVTLGRVTLDPRISGTYTELSTTQTANFDKQLGWLKKSGVTDLYLLAGNVSGTAWQTSYRTTFIADIALAVKYLQNRGYRVTAISPFNEPDFGENHAPGAAEMATVARLMRENETLANIDVCGPSTLNPDYGLSWWSSMAADIQIGNTHQLAGTYDNFAGFYQAVAASGKKSTGDEMHNINDALIGMNYGMTEGIWWSDFGGYTRAELGRTTGDGTRIAYAENRSAWTSAAVFKRKSEQMVQAYLGTSERQATESAYTFVSKDRLAYYDGHGPFYEYTKATPGGTGYQTGQTNSEYVIEITYGEDVPVGAPEGRFKIVNKATGKLLTANSLDNGGSLGQYAEAKSRNQTWDIAPIDPRSSGDFSYVHITAAKNSNSYLDAVKYEASNGAGIIMYAGGGNECERWHLRYMGDGYYVITNHDSGLSLEGSSNGTDQNTTGVVQWERTGSDRQLWKLVPADATVESEAPATPQNLQVEAGAGSIALTWEIGTEADLLGYMIYRYDGETGIWETIGRCIEGDQFVDNICRKGKDYKYRIRAVDQAWNLSEPSAETALCHTTEEAVLVAHWPLGKDTKDSTPGMMHAQATGGEYVTNGIHSGIRLDGTDDYISLPYYTGDLEQMTFCAWVKPGSTTAWQRIFDFGNSTSDYLFLTPSNGNYLRFEICKDGNKQGLNATKRLTAGLWTHVTVTLGNDGVKIYLNGALNAQTTDITLRPADINANLCFLGRSMFAADPMLNGTLSDVRVYNHVLEADKVEALYYDSRLEIARELTGKPMYSETAEALATAISETENAIATGDDTAISDAMNTLGTATNKARTSAETYAPLGDMLAWSANTAKSYPQTGEGASAKYEAAYSAAETAYLGGVHQDSEIDGAIIEVKKLTAGYLMTDIVKIATEEAPQEISHLLVNADFSTGSTTGWDITTNSTEYTGTVDYNCLEMRGCTFDISQSLYGMPNGKYRLDTQAFYRNGPKTNSSVSVVNVTLCLGDTAITIAPISNGANTLTQAGEWYEYLTNKNVPNDIEAAAAAFNKMLRYRPTSNTNRLSTMYENTEDGVLEVALKKSKIVADDWTVVNYFKLYYLGDPNASAIGETFRDTRQTDDADCPVYDLTGRKVADNARQLRGLKNGIYIQNGRKLVVE